MTIPSWVSPIRITKLHRSPQADLELLGFAGLLKGGDPLKDRVESLPVDTDNLVSASDPPKTVKS